MLSIDHLNVEYRRHGQTLLAVRDLSLTIAPGETVGLVGESGSGKSTVALSILRLIRPQEGRITSGQIVFQGEDLLRATPERLRAIRGKRISMIFQDPFTALNPVMRIRDQMGEMGGVAGDRRLEEALAQVQLDPQRVLNAYPHQLSGGQRQRVMIAMALLGRPDLILADEPTTALDMLVQKEVLDLLFRIQQEMKMAILLISHNLPLVAQYTQNLVVMQGGVAVEQGPSQDVLRRPKHPYTQSLIDALRHLSKVI